MTRLFCGAAVAAALLISATPSSAQVVTMTATLNGGEETPILLTGAVGTATVSVDATNEELSVTLSVFNLMYATTAGHKPHRAEGHCRSSGHQLPDSDRPHGRSAAAVPGRRGRIRRASRDRHQHDGRRHPGDCRGQCLRERPHVSEPGRRDRGQFGQWRMSGNQDSGIGKQGWARLQETAPCPALIPDSADCDCGREPLARNYRRTCRSGRPAIQHRQQQVGHRRVLRVADVPPALQPARGAAREDDRQVGVVVRVAVAHPAAVEHQRVVEQRAVAVGRGLQLARGST